MELPPGVDARYDWLSGVVQLDATRNEFEDAFNLTATEIVEHTDRGTVRLRVSIEKARVHNAFIHESIHFFQVVTTGYVYRWAVEYVVYAVRSWLQSAGEHHNELSVKQEVLRGRMKATDAQREFLFAHLRTLDRPGASGITVRSLIESHAYFIQMRGLFDLTSAQLTQALNDCPDLEYRVAYDAVRFVIGDEAAFDLFPLLCSASLCTSDPVRAFVQLIFLDQRLKTLREDVRAGRFLSAWEVLRDELKELWLGTAPQVRAANAEPAHPTCSPAVDRLIELDDTAHPQLLTSWFADPQFSRMETLSVASELPVMLRSTDEGDFPILVASDRQGELIGSALSVSAIARCFFGEAADWTGTDAEVSPLSPLQWLTRDSHDVLGLEVSTDELLAVDTLHVEELLRPVDGEFVERESSILESGERLANIVSPNKKSQTGLSWHEMFIGRFRLIFQDSPANLGHSNRRAYVAKLVERVPAAPAYMSSFEWFGALSDPNDNTFPLAIAEAVVTIGKVAKNINLNAWLQVRSMLSVYPPDFAELFLQHPLFEDRPMREN